MARSGNQDPLLRYKFTVYIEVDNNPNQFKKLAFMSVTPPRVDLITNQYREGGRHLNPRSITEGATFTAVTMRRGKSFSKDFYNWIGQVYKAFYEDDNGNSTNYRGRVVIDHHDRLGNVIKKYVLVNARPSGYIPASNFDSRDDSDVSIETLTLEYEGYEEYSVDPSFLGSILGSSGSELLGRATGSNPNSLPAGLNLPNR
jgi:phage tail-like protein